MDFWQSESKNSKLSSEIQRKVDGAEPPRRAAPLEQPETKHNTQATYNATLYFLIFMRASTGIGK